MLIVRSAPSPRAGRGRVALLLCLATLALVTAACAALGDGEPAASTPTRAAGPLSLAAYQGEDVLGGKEVAFSDVLERSTPVVLNFWAGLCVPCRTEMPWLQAAHERYEGRVLLVGVDVGPFLGLGSHEDGRELLESLGVTYPSAYALSPEILRNYEVVGMPTTVFFDADGGEIKKHTGLLTEAQIEEEFRRLAESAAAPKAGTY